MKTDTKKRIIELVTEKERSVKELSGVLDMSTQVIHRHLKTLVEQRVIKKRGSAPKVIYQVAQEGKKINHALNTNDVHLLDGDFTQILPDGTRLEGLDAFLYWCSERNYDPNKKIEEYRHVVNKYKSEKIDGLYDATDKLLHSFDNQGPEKMWYTELYSYEIFGKTKMGQLVLHGKSSGDKKIIKEIGEQIHDTVKKLVSTEKVDAVVFVPHTIKRPVQFMSEIRRHLSINDRAIINVEKINNTIVVAQKTLKNKKDRQSNARETFFIPEPGNQQGLGTVLLIDDAVGSGASFYEIGRKLRRQGIAQRVICLGIVGSANDFPIINEA